MGAKMTSELRTFKLYHPDTNTWGSGMLRRVHGFVDISSYPHMIWESNGGMVHYSRIDYIQFTSGLTPKFPRESVDKDGK
jgi:hypothetical protein